MLATGSFSLPTHLSTMMVTKVNGIPFEVNGFHDYRSGSGSKYSLLKGTEEARETLLVQAKKHIPPEFVEFIRKVAFKNTAADLPVFPGPFKETEAIGALKALEAGIATAIAERIQSRKDRKAVVDLRRASCFLFSTYLITIGGYGKGDAESKEFLKDTDLNAAQSILYRRLSANLYETKDPGKYFHLHGSLEATIALNMIGLPGHREDMTEYSRCIDLIENHVKQYTTEELEAMNAKNGQAGVTCLKFEDFMRTEQGKKLVSEPPYRVDALELVTPPTPFSGLTSSSVNQMPQILTGIKVLELCRIIAGPSVGKGLAEYGAQVLKVTSPSLSDVPFFQVDVSVGKHCADLDLRSPVDRQRFEELLQDTDVVLDGYRPGALASLGYGPEQLRDMALQRGKGIVYVAENCFGHVGPWRGRRGWQQIADCVTGVAWAQGRFMRLDEPVVPPFPKSDYGSGCLGTIAALTGLYLRAQDGGSYVGTTSLSQYDLFLLSLGLHSGYVQQRLREVHDEDFFALRHSDSVDEVGKRAIKSMRRVSPELFVESNKGYFYSKAFGTNVSFLKPVVGVEGTWNGWIRGPRQNGFDQASWDEWEVEDEMIQACDAA